MEATQARGILLVKRKETQSPERAHTEGQTSKAHLEGRRMKCRLLFVLFVVCESRRDSRDESRQLVAIDSSDLLVCFPALRHYVGNVARRARRAL